MALPYVRPPGGGLVAASLYGLLSGIAGRCGGREEATAAGVGGNAEGAVLPTRRPRGGHNPSPSCAHGKWHNTFWAGDALLWGYPQTVFLAAGAVVEAGAVGRGHRRVR